MKRGWSGFQKAACFASFERVAMTTWGRLGPLDDGKTWSPPVSSGFKGVAPHLRLLSNGLLALTTGRPGPVTIMFSTDEGKKWVGITPIFTGKSTRYSDLIELEPGKLLVVYDSVPYWSGPHPALRQVV